MDTPNAYHVDRITLEPQTVAVVSGSAELDGIGAFLGRAFAEVLDVLAAQGLAPHGPPFARYALTDDGWDVQAGFPVAAEVVDTGRVHASELPGGTAVAVLHRGAYEDVGGAYTAAERWLEENEWAATAAPWEVYLDEPSVPNPRTIVQWPARPS